MFWTTTGILLICDGIHIYEKEDLSQLDQFAVFGY